MTGRMARTRTFSAAAIGLVAAASFSACGGSARGGVGTAASQPVISAITEFSAGCAGRNSEVEQAVDPVRGYVYEEWMGCKYQIGFAASADGGLHFGKPVVLAGSAGAWDPALAVAPDGHLVRRLHDVDRPSRVPRRRGVVRPRTDVSPHHQAGTAAARQLGRPGLHRCQPDRGRVSDLGLRPERQGRPGRSSAARPGAARSPPATSTSWCRGRPTGPGPGGRSRMSVPGSRPAAPTAHRCSYSLTAASTPLPGLPHDQPDEAHHDDGAQPRHVVGRLRLHVVGTGAYRSGRAHHEQDRVVDRRRHLGRRSGHPVCHLGHPVGRSRHRVAVVFDRPGQALVASCASRPTPTRPRTWSRWQAAGRASRMWAGLRTSSSRGYALYVRPFSISKGWLSAPIRVSGPTATRRSGRATRSASRPSQPCIPAREEAGHGSSSAG